MQSRGGSGAYKKYMAEEDGKVKDSLANIAVQEALEATLSADRLTKYMAEANGDRKAAIRLYAWNTAISAAFYGPLQILEVAIRNAMHAQLINAYGAHWYDNGAAGLDKGCKERIARAKDDLRREGRPIDPPRMVAALSFGLWVSLLGAGGRRGAGQPKANYEMTLWRPALRNAFPNAPSLSRKKAHEPLNHLRFLRNRIAHHEPIFERHLEQDYQTILDIVGWVSEPTRDWLKQSARVDDVLAMKSNQGDVCF